MFNSIHSPYGSTPNQWYSIVSARKGVDLTPLAEDTNDDLAKDHVFSTTTPFSDWFQSVTK